METGLPANTASALAMTFKFSIKYSKNPETAHNVNSSFIKLGYTNTDILEAVQNDDVILKSIPDILAIYKSSKNKVIAPRLAYGTHYLFYKKNPDKANYFMRALCTGENPLNNKVTHKLRELFLADDRKKFKTYSSRDKILLIITAWNYFINDVNPKTISLSGLKSIPVVMPI